MHTTHALPSTPEHATFFVRVAFHVVFLWFHLVIQCRAANKKYFLFAFLSLPYTYYTSRFTCGIIEPYYDSYQSCENFALVTHSLSRSNKFRAFVTSTFINSKLMHCESSILCVTQSRVTHQSDIMRIYLQQQL
jgi:hypothetical protein